MSLLSQVVAAAYPAGDLLVLALAFRLLTAGMVRNEALWALLGSLGTLLVADLAYVISVVEDAAYPSWIDVVFLSSYLLLGFAALHPSALDLSEPAPDRPNRITGARLAWLGAALMLAPVTDEVGHLTGYDNAAWVVLVGGCVAAVLVVLRLWDLVKDLQSKAVQLAALARKDGLTGVPNRRTWDHELSRACAFARERGTPLSAAVLDMDHFKQFNDTFGHMTGDGHRDTRGTGLPRAAGRHARPGLPARRARPAAAVGGVGHDVAARAGAGHRREREPFVPIRPGIPCDSTRHLRRFDGSVVSPREGRRPGGPRRAPPSRAGGSRRRRGRRRRTRG